jgi:hypothetical protein
MQVSLLFFYGSFLLISGFVSVLFIGMKAKTALASGGTSSCISFFIAYLLMNQVEAAKWAGIGLSLGLFIVFCWRSTKTLFKLFELIPAGGEELRKKGIAFLIISLMAVTSLFVFAGQWMIIWAM